MYRQYLVGLVLSCCFVFGFFPIEALSQQPQRPVVIVPGIIGSKLCDTQGNVIWGDRRSLRRFAQLELNGSESSESLQPCGLIDRIHILGPFWTVDAYVGLQRNLRGYGFGSAGYPLHEFSYDWRRSNYDSALKLKAFVDENLPGDGKFDIVAHSMGGIVTRIYLFELGGAARVANVAYFGTPFLGSVNTFATMASGWGGLQNSMAGGIDAIRRVMLSFPGMLELLPRFDRCCRISANGTQFTSLDIFNPEVWRNLGWLPEGMQTGERFEKFGQQLEKSKELGGVLGKAAPDGVQEFRFAGSAHETSFQLQMMANATTPDDWILAKQKGDGTVPVWSAAADSTLGGNLSDTLVAFAEHQTLFVGDAPREQLKRILTRDQPDWGQLVSGGEPVLTLDVDLAGRTEAWELETVDFTTPEVIVAANSTVTAELILHFRSGTNVARGEFMPAVSMKREDTEQQLQVVETTTDGDVAGDRLRFSITGVTGGTDAVETMIARFEDDQAVTLNIQVMEP